MEDHYNENATGNGGWYYVIGHNTQSDGTQTGHKSSVNMIRSPRLVVVK